MFAKGRSREIFFLSSFLFFSPLKRVNEFTANTCPAVGINYLVTRGVRKLGRPRYCLSTRPLVYFVCLVISTAMRKVMSYTRPSGRETVSKTFGKPYARFTYRVETSVHSSINVRLCDSRREKKNDNNKYYRKWLAAIIPLLRIRPIV